MIKQYKPNENLLPMNPCPIEHATQRPEEVCNADHQHRNTICLYHFTGLVYLPIILRHGIRRGEVPISPNGPIPNAANLTAIESRGAQEWNNNRNVVDKTRVRLKVEAKPMQLTTFMEIASTYRMTQRWIKALDPLGQRSKWFFAFDGIPAEQIVEISIFHGDRYESISGERLSALCQQIERECDKLDLVLTPRGLCASIDDIVKSFLFDGPAAKQLRSKRQQVTLEQKRSAAKSRKRRRIRKQARNQRKSNRRSGI